MTRRRAGASAVGALLVGAIGAGPAFGACRPADAQPKIDAGFRIGIARSGQGHPKDRGVIANMFKATHAQAQGMGGGLRILTDSALASPTALADLKVVILPEVKGLSGAQRRALLAWVKKGGGLVSLYFDGRDDADGTPLVRKGFGGRTEWGALSPAFGANFINDAFMTQASFGMEQGHPLVAAASRFCGEALPDYAWRRDQRPIALTGELVEPNSAAFSPVARLRTVKITWKRPERKAQPGAVFAFTNQYGAGRVVHFGFNFIDAWQPWTFQKYYAGVDPTGPNTGVALLRGSVQWASGRA
jgi:hypothetical protein